MAIPILFGTLMLAGMLIYLVNAFAPPEHL
jgi:hypothetical protein